MMLLTRGWNDLGVGRPTARLAARARGLTTSSPLWETPAKEKDRAAARAALVILIAPSLNRLEDLYG